MLKFLRRLFLGPEPESNDDTPVTMVPEVKESLSEKKQTRGRKPAEGKTTSGRGKKKA
jgi:hypothetical protein